MALIKLTDRHYVETEMVAGAYLQQQYGGPCLEMFFKAQHLEQIVISGEEAVDGWANWRSYVDLNTEETCDCKNELVTAEEENTEHET